MQRPTCSHALLLAAACLALAGGGCKGATGNSPASPATPKAATCASVAAHVGSFAEVLEASSLDAKTRVVTYAGLLELLLAFEGAAIELDAELATLHPHRDLEGSVRRARGSLERSAQFARAERDAIEKHAREIAPLAKETQQAWSVLRGTCDGRKKGPPDCAGVRDVVAKFDAAETSAEHEKAVAELVALRLSTPVLARSRDRAVAASRAVQTALKTHSDTASPMPKRWAAVQRDLSGAMDGLVRACKGEAPAAPPLVVAEHPDPRKLTVLVHVKPPAAVERALLALAAKAEDEDDKAFYQARAEGAFGSGFFLVKKTEKGSEVLVVTNRHVVELGDRAALELADGSSLGLADVVYANPTHDLAVLRPTTKLPVREGFALARAPAKDQQAVVATGFPGLIGRPSYQTTKGYVSNESFRLDDGSRPLIYVQHTAPIDPGSSGGPLTDESGRVLGVNTLKIAGRDGVGFAVPSRYVLDTIRTAGLVESRHASRSHRQKDGRLACLGFLAELGADPPRMLTLEQMISNHLVGVVGLDAAGALSGEEGFEQLWNADSVRAMRVATLVKLHSDFLAGGGPSVLETCDDVDPASVRSDQIKYRVRLGNFETREMTLRWEQGRWKIDGFEAARSATVKAPAKRLPPPGPPSGGRTAPRKVTPPGRPK